ncbi:uncharacterized protein LOC143219007 isoform X2 [Lasioglossum baleicum]|uniref:uncharacterized protein LOC143219007 isoform X2 n=1 Tax=Lasioglossum baleicum TaxID=434251 RepID=UPI003FCDD46F
MALFTVAHCKGETKIDHSPLENIDKSKLKIKLFSTMMLVGLQLYCIENGDTSFPLDKRMELAEKIKNKINQMTNYLLRKDAKEFKMLGLALLDYESTLKKGQFSLEFNKSLAKAIIYYYRKLALGDLRPLDTKYMTGPTKDQYRYITTVTSVLDDYFEVRRNSNSLYTISRGIGSILESIKVEGTTADEKRLAVQEALRRSGEYLKGTKDTPNLDGKLGTELKMEGIPVANLITFRNTLIHKHLFPLIENETVDKISEDLTVVKYIINNEIDKLTSEFISRIIDQNFKKIEVFYESFKDILSIKMPDKSIPDIISALESIKKGNSYMSLRNNGKALIDEIYENAKQIDNLGFPSRETNNSEFIRFIIDQNFGKIQDKSFKNIVKYNDKLNMTDEKKSIRGIISALESIKKENSYMTLKKKDKALIDEIYENAKQINSPRKTNNSEFIRFIIHQNFGKIQDESFKNIVKNDKSLNMTDKKKSIPDIISALELIKRENSYKSLTNNDKALIDGIYENAKQINPQRFPSRETNNSNKPVKKYWASSLAEATKDSNTIEKLRKKVGTDVIKNVKGVKSQAIQILFYGIIDGIDGEPRSQSLQLALEQHLLKNQVQESDAAEAIKHLGKFYSKKIKSEFYLLKTLKNDYAIRSQILNLYDVVQRNDDLVNTGSKYQWTAARMRNYLSHGSTLVTIEEDTVFTKDFAKLVREAFIGELEKVEDITMVTIEQAIERVITKDAVTLPKEVLEVLGRVRVLICGDTGLSRRRRSVKSCLEWTEIDKFSKGGAANRDPDNIIIDSKKFIETISNERGANKEKFSNFIALASESEVIGDYKDKVNMLTNNHKYISHLNRAGKVSGRVMHGMFAKDIIGAVLRKDYVGAAEMAGFFGVSYGLTEVAEVASRKGASFILKGKPWIGYPLRIGTPFIARFLSVLTARDLYNQVKRYQEGHKDALVPIILDSAQLGVDVILVGLEIGAVAGVASLQGISAATGPIGIIVGATIFVVYDGIMTVQTVRKIDEQIDLTGWEMFSEGLRAFFVIQPSEKIERLIEEKGANNAAVNLTISYLESNSDIQRYVFPSIRVVEHDSEIILDNVVLLDQKRYDIKWSRTRPDVLKEVDLFCLPKGNWETVSTNGTYYCDGAIGVEYKNNRTGNYTLIRLGDGTDRVKGFQESSNIFVLGDGHKEMTGGNKDDDFSFENKSVNALVDREIKGSIDGGGGINTIDVGNLTPHDEGSNGGGRYQVSADFRQGILKVGNSNVALHISNINKFLGRTGRVDHVVPACDTKYMDGKGGENKNDLDSITIPKDDACFYDTSIVVNPYTKVTNSAINGKFSYFVKGEKGKEAYIDLGRNSQSNNAFVFNYTLTDIAAIDKSEENITFSFVEEFYKREKEVNVDSSFHLTVSGADENTTTYNLIDSTKIVMAKPNIVYAIQNTEKSIDSLVKDYSSIAERSQMYVIVYSNGEVLIIGHSHDNILMNEPKARVTHLVGGSGENLYVVASGYEKLTLAKLPVPDVIIYDFDRENQVDTLDLRNIKEQMIQDIDREINTKVSKINSDLLINLCLDDASKKEVVKIRLKGALENNWYKRVNIVIDSIFVIEEILEEFELTPQPLIFDDNSQTIYVISPKDVAEGNKIRVKKEIGDYTFARDNDALIITNSLSSSADKNNLSIIILYDFYYEKNQDKMLTLKIEFNDKKIFLRKDKKRISSAGSFSELTKKVDIDSNDAVMYEIQKQKLFEAIERNNIGDVKELINHGVSIDAKNNDGQTPLHYAAKSDKLEVVKYLIEEKGANVNVKDNDGQTPLHSAAKSDKLEVVKYLIEEKGANVNAKDNHGQTPLHSAAKSDKLEVIKYLIEEKGANVNVKDDDGRTLLHSAAKTCRLEIVKYLIEEKRVDFNVKDNYGITPLHYAAMNDGLEVVKYFIDKKQVDFNVGDMYKITPLHYAAMYNGLEVVKYLIEEKTADINVKDDSGMVVLYYAAAGNNIEVVRYLTEKQNANMNVTDNAAKTPLHYAAQSGKLEVVKYLIEEKGANANVKDNEGQTPLHHAANSDNLEVVKYFIEEKHIDFNVKDNYGITPLHYAADHGKLEVVRYLIEGKNANINVKDNDGQTPLHHAADHSKLEVVKYLIEKSADVNVRDNEGRTSLHYAAYSYKPKVVKYLIEKGAKIDLKGNGELPLEILERGGHRSLADSIIKELTERLFYAVKYDDFGEVQGLINQGVSVNVKNSDGQTLLQYAVSNGKLKVVKYLAEKGADVNERNVSGDAPLHDAVRMGNLEVLKCLVEKGADVNVKDNYRLTPLHYAVVYNRLEILKYLVEEKTADINVKDSSGMVVLHHAAATNNIEVVRYLIEKNNANINVTDNAGKTTLQYAAESGKIEVIKYLIEEKGANANVKDNFGLTPLHYATNSDKLEVVKYFIEEKHIDFNVKDNYGLTTLHYAADHGKLEIVKYLIEKGADVNVRDNEGRTSLHYAAYSYKPKVVKYLIEKGAKIDLKGNGELPLEILERRGHRSLADSIIKELTERLFDAVKYDDFSKVQGLINQGVSVNVKNSDGQTLLQYAVSNGKPKIEKYLVEIGATLSHAAARYNMQEIAKCLEEEGADVNVKDSFGVTTNKLKAILKYLLEEGADVNGKDYSGSTLLDMAVWFNMQEIVKCLVEKGADVNVKSSSGSTPLFSAGLNNNPKLAKYLIEKGADVNVKDNLGSTVLHYAAQNQMSYMVEWLVENGADINVTNGRGQTPLDLARVNRFSASVYYLEKKLNEKREKRPQRKRRHHHGDRNRHHSSHRPLTIDSSNQPGIATSNASQKSSWINDLVGWVKNSIGGLLGSRAALSETSANYSNTAKNYGNQYTSQFSSEVCINNNVGLGFFLLQSFLDKKYPLPKFCSLTYEEALANTMNIVGEFEKTLEKTAKQSGVLIKDVNFFRVYLDMADHVWNERYSQIPNTLYSAAKEACPKNEKFLSILKGNIEKMLDRQQTVNSNNHEQEPANDIGLIGVTCADQVA